MSFQSTTRAVRWANQLPATRDVGNAALRTLAALAVRANAARGYQAWPGIELLATERGLSRSTIKRHLRALEAAGHISAVVGTDLPARVVAKPVNRRPVVWALQVGDFEGSQVGALDGPQVGAVGGATAGNRTTEERTEEELQGKGGVAVRSQAYAELGGQATTPPPKRYPKQCAKHQAALHTDSCQACGASRVAHDESERAARRDAAARERTARRDALKRAIDACDACDDSGRRDDGINCLHPPRLSPAEQARADAAKRAAFESARAGLAERRTERVAAGEAIT